MQMCSDTVKHISANSYCIHQSFMLPKTQYYPFENGIVKSKENPEEAI